MSDQALMEKLCSEYKEKVYVVWEKLMGLELQLVDQLEEAIKDFERNLQEMVTGFIENLQVRCLCDLCYLSIKELDVREVLKPQWQRWSQIRKR